MNEPRVQALGGTYVLTWPDEGLEIVADRLRRSQDDDVLGEITIRCIEPTGQKRDLQAPAKLNMTSTAAKNALAKRLGERLDVDWYAAIEQTCRLVVADYRRGEPSIILADLPPPSPTRYRLHPLMFEGRPNLVYAKGGSGKSLLAKFLAVLIAAGQPACGFKPLQGNVAYWDWEAEPQDTQEQISQIAKGLGLAIPRNIIYRYCHQALSYDLSELRHIVAEHAIQVAMVDSAAGAAGASVNDDEAAVRTFMALRALKVTAFIVAHLRKNQADGTGPVGSVFWRNYPRQVIEARADMPADHQLNLALFNDKANSAGLFRPIALRINFGDTIQFSRIDVTETAAEGRVVLRQRIEAALKRNGPMLAGALAEAVGDDVKPNSVLKTLQRSEQFVHIADGPQAGRWALRADDVAV